MRLHIADQGQLLFRSVHAYNSARPMQNSCSSMRIRAVAGPRGLHRNCYELGRVTDTRYRHHLKRGADYHVEIKRFFALCGLVHNHPSGDPSPSRADITITRTIAEAGLPMGIVLHDHIIMGINGHVSLKAQGLI